MKKLPYCIETLKLSFVLHIDIYTIDSAIHRVVCQKYDVLDNSDIQNSQKQDPLEKTVKKI
jgi:hypothetical protein